MKSDLIDLPTPCRRTRHFAQRADERKLPVDVEKFVGTFGTRFPSWDERFCVFVVRQNLPPEIRKHPIVDRARGWLLVIDRDNAVVTCFHNEHACKKIRRAA